jgi:hypothetical protein
MRSDIHSDASPDLTFPRGQDPNESARDVKHQIDLNSDVGEGFGP